MSCEVWLSPVQQQTIIFILIQLESCIALNNGVAPTPGMGWSTWNRYGCNINESVIIDNANAMIKSGLVNYGYEYINIDDCWAVGRNESTNELIADPVAFPNGIKYIADYLHSVGLKMGIYTDASPITWQKRPGSFGFEQLDADTFASWGIDYVKEDWMKQSFYNWTGDPIALYTKMSDCLNATGRDIYFAVCEWGIDNVQTWAPAIANSWRTAPDIKDEWTRIMEILDLQLPLTNASGVGSGWNDMDSLEVGNGNMSTIEYTTHFSIWCMMASPLIMGNDLTNMDDDTLAILSATEMIEVNQDTLGIQAYRVYQNTSESTEIYVRPLDDGTHAVMLLNRNDNDTLNIELDLGLLGLPTTLNCLIRDIWKQQDLGVYSGSYISDNVPPHGCVVLKVVWMD
ncbi:hypothetical protein DFA_08164 [Cavenderia fasciculata]|uniref:Alpha-galactosidase n=1 Tax=Cavenderia fasciculata TaxID=261658 RepID=F4Q5C1_CACFS|nr:uncharacterized protein DFA_08164 [Cavenderia fasciculata]EGG17180.1 hypothetical protein DFA_08164 [Cavenderia fasciculata]|eukprot:XP_004355664.1 hypothetical protein DFA_08164 [Cavenderia fasciculata]